MLPDIDFSEGAQRVIQATRAALAAAEGRSSPAKQLLFAMWQDESRAAEILAAGGLDSEKLARFLSIDVAKIEHGEPIAFETSLERILRTTRQFAATDRQRAELGTEQLLTGLMQSDPTCREFLEQFGIRTESHGDRESDRTPSIGPPIETTVEIEWSDPLEGTDDPGNVEGVMHHVADASTESHVLRILDAVSNRGREGLRVVEDYVRFHLGDAHLSSCLKQLRHDLVEALAQLGQSSFHRMRDVPGDVGTGMTAGQEFIRATPGDVVRANCKRIQESLRSLEEYGKLVNPAAAAEIEQLRYRCCTLEQAILTTLESRAQLRDCRLYLLVTPEECPHGFEATVRAALDGGVNVVQLRIKGADDRRICAAARRGRDWTRDSGALFIMNDRADIAVAADADGVHVGQDDLPVRDARRIVGPDRLVGVSTHTIEQARQAVLDGADYIGVGPVFPSATKQFDELAGLDFVREVAAEITLPWFAIGGVSPETAPDAVAAGASRAAVSSAITQSDEIETTARLLREHLS